MHTIGRPHAPLGTPCECFFGDPVGVADIAYDSDFPVFTAPRAPRSQKTVVIGTVC